MSDETPTPTQEFFRSWQLYQDVIQHNYMAHREIVAGLQEFYSTQGKDGMAILDLGCGDAYTVRTAWAKKFHNVSYTGVDLSGPALQFAKEAFSNTDWTANLIEADLTTALEQLTEPFDLILAGHSLHHIQEPAKQRALVRMRELLKTEGSGLIYDLLPRVGETRDAYVERLLYENERDWNLLSIEQLRSIRSHVENFDFPIELSTWQQYAEAAGFSECELLFRVDKDHYGLMHLSP